MDKHAPGSHQAIDEAIGSYGPALAELLGLSADTIESWRCPPPDFTPHGAHNRGRRNPADEVVRIAQRCPNGMSLIHWINEQVGGRYLPNVTTPHAGRLLVEPAGLLAAVETLCTELNRRKPKMSNGQIAHLAETVADDLAALVADRLARRKEPQ